jgi:LacI family transcriptional regulator
MKRPTLRDLAGELDLTESTVSRALNGYSDISAKTIARVQTAALELGYKPNQNARRLATGVAEAVAFVIPQHHGSIGEAFIAQLLQGLDESLARRGWDLLVSHSLAAEQEAKTIQRLVTSGRVGGVVLSRPFRHDARIDLLQEAGFPFVVHGRSAVCDDYAWYDIDNELAFESAVKHLVDLGHHRIGFVGAPLYFNFAYQRLEGYKRGLHNAGLEFDDAIVHITELTDDAGERAASDLLSLSVPPSAMLCVSDTLACGVLAGIRARGLVAGKHVSVIGYDGLKIGRHTNPPLTTMSQPLAQSGRELGDMLLAIIDGDDPTEHQILKRAELLIRNSDGPLWTQHHH